MANGYISPDTGISLGGEPIGLPPVGSFEESSRPSGGLSYDSDIAPLQKRLFRNVESSALSDAQKNALVFGMADNVEKIRSMRQKAEMQEQQMRLRDLQYRSTLAAMDEDRSKKLNDKKIKDQTIAATTELDAFIADPSLTDTQRQKAIARWGIKNADLLSKSPGARAAKVSAENWASANETEKDPANFAKTVAGLGLDPYSPEVAKMPGSTPLGLKLAQQAHDRQKQIREDSAEATASSKRSAEMQSKQDARVKSWIEDKRELASSVKTDDGLSPITDESGYIYKEEKDKGNPTKSIGHISDLSAKDERAMEGILSMSATGAETDQKFEIENNWGSLSDAEKLNKYRTIHQNEAKIKLADRIARRIANERAGTGEGMTTTQAKFTAKSGGSTKEKLDKITEEIERLQQEADALRD